MKTRSRPLWLAFAVCGLLCQPFSAAWAFALPDLMTMLAQQRTGSATFKETRFVRDLDAPISASGTLSFEVPDKMTRRTTEPRAETLAVDGNTLTLSRGGRTRTVALDSMPEMLGVVESMRSTLTGNLPTLQKYFRTTLSGSPDDWVLDLEPLDARLKVQVLSVRITGRQGQVRGVDMVFGGGDRSSTAITPVAAPTAAKP